MSNVTLSRARSSSEPLDPIPPRARITSPRRAAIHRLALYAVLVAVVGLAACDKNPVIIYYAQRVNSDLYDTDPTSGQPHTTTSGGNSLFYITKIENPAKGKTFHFKPSRLFVSQKSNGGGWTQSWASTAIGPWRAGDVTVAPGTTKTNVGCVAVPVGAEAKKFAYFMLYDSSIEDDSVLLTREGPASANIEDVILSPGAFAPRCKP